MLGTIAECHISHTEFLDKNWADDALRIADYTPLLHYAIRKRIDHISAETIQVLVSYSVGPVILWKGLRVLLQFANVFFFF